jgi:hypothetical protein
MRKIPAFFTAAIVMGIVGCGSSSSSSTGSSTTTAASASGVNPNQRETLPPGDIPDTIAYVPYTDSGLGLTVSTPEGWSRANTAGAVKFTDKLNEVQVFTLAASGPTTAASAKSAEVPKFASSVKGFKLQSITTVSRPAGPAVRITYLGDSRPDAVTGKVGTLAFERYDFFHKGKEVVLLLSSPNGSDNVDPWKKVTSSLRFTR